MRDRRESERLPSILEGRIVLDRQASKLQCTLRDISATGARIWLPATLALPHEFDLEIPALEQTMPVRLMWSKGRTHGVMFLQELQAQTGGLSDGVLDDLPRAEPPASPDGVPRGLVPLTEDVLADARRQLADILDLPVEKIRLTLELDP